MAEGNGVEMENSVLGKLKVSGHYANLFFTVAGTIFSALVLALLYIHMGDTREGNRDLSAAMREAAQAAREQNCLISMPQDRREANAELCKRLSR